MLIPPRARKSGRGDAHAFASRVRRRWPAIARCEQHRTPWDWRESLRGCVHDAIPDRVEAGTSSRRRGVHGIVPRTVSRGLRASHRDDRHLLARPRGVRRELRIRRPGPRDTAAPARARAQDVERSAAAPRASQARPHRAGARTSPPWTSPRGRPRGAHGHAAADCATARTATRPPARRGSSNFRSARRRARRAGCDARSWAGRTRGGDLAGRHGLRLARRTFEGSTTRVRQGWLSWARRRAELPAGGTAASRSAERLDEKPRAERGRASVESLLEDDARRRRRGGGASGRVGGSPPSVGGRATRGVHHRVVLRVDDRVVSHEYTRR